MVARVKDTWSGTMPDNGLLSVDHTTEFYRLWSALQFVFCLPPDEGGMSCQEKFGDGFVWGGITLVYMLHQEQRFRVFDFCYHILNVEEALPVAGNAKDVRYATRCQSHGGATVADASLPHPSTPSLRSCRWPVKCGT
jgi:hypothetical protein